MNTLLPTPPFTAEDIEEYGLTLAENDGISDEDFFSDDSDDTESEDDNNGHS